MATSMISNLGSFKKTLAYHKRRIKETATQRVQRFTKDVLIDLAKNTPQWSGDLAASWQVVVGEGGSANWARATIYKTVPYERPAPYFKGDSPAVGYALEQNAEAIRSIRWNSTINIQNPNPTKDLIVEGRLRPGNYIAGDIMAIATVALMYNHKYRNNTNYASLSLKAGA